MANMKNGLDRAYELRRFEQHMAAGALGCLLAVLVTYVSLTTAPATSEMIAAEADLSEVKTISVFPDFAAIDSVAVHRTQQRMAERDRWRPDRMAAWRIECCDSGKALCISDGLTTAALCLEATATACLSAWSS